MGSSGGVVQVGPTTFRIAVPTLPLVAVTIPGLVPPYTTLIDWEEPMPDANYSMYLRQASLLGKAVATLLAPTKTGVTLSVTASLLLAAGAQVHILAWA